ncbi:MAG: hypothetical protein MUC47_08345 [Candidatus Kapabacteria bacterium]|nr:hypothetical protein [Candidatus Kapabacteria bacterium]
MTNDELLAGFLDRSLSEDQLLELEARRASSPEFAQELQNLINLEASLPAARPAAAAPAAFLATVENAIAANLATTVATGAAGAGLSWLSIAGISAAVVAAGVATTLWLTQPAEPAHTVTAPQSAVPTLVQPAQPQPSTVEQSIPTPSKASTPPVVEQVPPSVEAHASAENPASAEARLRQRYEAATGLERITTGLSLAARDQRNAVTILLDVQHVADAARITNYQAIVRARRAEHASSIAERSALLREAITLGEQASMDPSMIASWKKRLAELAP